jgi:hypothetical protein
VARPVLNLGWRILAKAFRRLGLLRWLVAASSILASLPFVSGEARAQTDEDRYGWRRQERPPESPQRFAFEFRVGPYTPHIDDDFPQVKPYETVFGTDQRWFIGTEFDWQLLRIPKVGTLGPGIGWAYTHMSALAKLADGTDSGQDTNLAIMPMYGVGVLRVDVLARETVVPLVGYAKAGIGYGLYWSSDVLGTHMKGHTWGTHFALGGMLLLDAFDEHAAVEIDNEWGINNSYLFVEWMMANLNGFGQSSNLSVMNIGTNTWLIGLALEM